MTNFKDQSKNLDFKQKPNSGSSKESMSHKAGDMLERAGEKIKNAGAEKIGNAIYKAGNKLEHRDEKNKKSSH
ncbi:MAG: hypothetical protein B7Y39_03655 [Bdellovibrio sp. 28-41-41]|nr:MAG: hypothetical protein B7Y39_03655 [Bdellovibrio sp. 28-41-41]